VEQEHPIVIYAGLTARKKRKNTYQGKKSGFDW